MKFDNITFTTEYIAKPNRDYTSKIKNLHAYGFFEKWWENPKFYLQKGAIFSIVKDGDIPIGVGIINFDYHESFYCRSYVKTKKYTYKIIGSVGFYVEYNYREGALGKELARLIENKLMDTFPKFNDSSVIPMVLTYGNANKITSKVFNKIKSIDVITLPLSRNLNYKNVKKSIKKSYRRKYGDISGW